MGIIKDGSDNAKQFLEIADLVIICIYPRIIKDFMMENRNNFKDGAIVTDVAGIKGTLIKQLDDIIPDNIDFIFGQVVKIKGLTMLLQNVIKVQIIY